MSARVQQFKKTLAKDKWLYILALPGLLYFILFRIFPMWGLVISFQEYSPYRGFFESEWVGLGNFIRLFNEPTFGMLLRNTLIIGLQNLVFYFPMPVILALLLNEIKIPWLKRGMQTITYLPHFLSWVVVVGIWYMLFSPADGVVNALLVESGRPVFNIMMDPAWLRPSLVIQSIWKEMGWGTIIFLAALTGINPSLYEAAEMDGANRMDKLLHITLPDLRSTIVIMLILRLGRFLDTGFEQIFNMLNAMNRSMGEVFDTFTYTMGITKGMFSYSTTVGLFKSLIALVLVIGANKLAHMMGEEGIY